MRNVFSNVKEKMTTLKKRISFGKEKRTEIEDLTEEGSTEDHEFLLCNWIVCCFNSKLVADSNQLNVVFSPVTTLSAYIALTIALHKEERKSLKSLFDVSGKPVEHFSAQLKKIPPLEKSEVFFFLRLVTDKDDGLVQDKYMKILGRYFGPYTIVSLSPSDVSSYIAELTGNMVRSSPVRAGLTTGFCPAMVKAKWDGHVGKAASAPFAVGYGKRQMHSFFALKTQASTVSRDGFQAWSLPLHTASGRPSTLVLLRPHLTGSLLEMKKQMSGERLWDLFETLDDQKEIEHSLLLPACSVTVSDDVWTRWSNSYSPFAALKDESPMPPFHHLWHTAVFSMSPRGVGFSLPKPSDKSSGARSSDGSSTFSSSPKRPPYSARFDSPFFFFVLLENNATLVSGCYFGSPSPSKKSISIKIPKAIRNKPVKDACKRKRLKSQEKIRNVLIRATRQRHFFRKMAAVTKKKISSIKSCKSKKSCKSLVCSKSSKKSG